MCSFNVKNNKHNIFITYNGDYFSTTYKSLRCNFALLLILGLCVQFCVICSVASTRGLNRLSFSMPLSPSEISTAVEKVTQNRHTLKSCCDVTRVPSMLRTTNIISSLPTTETTSPALAVTKYLKHCHSSAVAR